METRKIAEKYNIDQYQFEDFLKEIGVGKLSFLSGAYILDDNIPHYVERFKNEYLKRLIENEKIEEEKQKVLANILITSGFNFDGYKVVKYSGYISGDDAIQIPRGTEGYIFQGGSTDVGQALTESLSKIRRQALKELKEAAYDLGCNAVIGVDFDYITLEPETANTAGGTTYLPYVFCVTANGNAVIIEKDDDK